ncbi:MAG: hypothetical protein ABIH25_01410 [Candidatus Woesearchaeota archaeon]
MALITFTEILYFVILSLIIGYIFSGAFTYRAKTVYEMGKKRKKFYWRDLGFAVLITAPAIVLHELAHKFVAMGFGFDATFQLFPLGLAIGVILKLVGSPFILVAPGFVEIGTAAFANPTAYRLIALAGPVINALLWLAATIVLKTRHNLNRTQKSGWKMTRMINLILFIFNMIPFGPLDGAKVLFGPPGG